MLTLEFFKYFKIYINSRVSFQVIESNKKRSKVWCDEPITERIKNLIN